MFTIIIIKMKQLKITINSEVKTFDLPENGEYKCEVEESYVPKAGDCVMIESKLTGISYWCKLTDITKKSVAFRLSVDSNLKTYENGFFYINSQYFYTKITPEELKAKYAEAGYDWDYETDTIKPIKWVPKDGDEVWYMDIYMEPLYFIFDEDNKGDKKLLDKGLLFPTEEECQKFADHCLSFIHKKNK